MKSSLVIGASIIIAALIVSATTASLLRYDKEWKGATLVKMDRLTGKIEACSVVSEFVIVCLPASQ